VDEHVASAEATAIEALASALDIDEDDSQAILHEVMAELFG